MADPNQGAARTVNQNVVIWARGQLGRKVGKGECWDLAEKALKTAGAQTSSDLGPVDDDTDYIWGDPIDIKDAIPGDIVQFRDHEVTTTTVTTYTFDDGSTDELTTTETAERGHHTAIVDKAMDSDGVVRTLDQHVKPRGKVVQEKKLYTRDVPTVQTTSVARHTNPTSKKVEAAKVTKEVTVTVTGTMWVYHPKERP